MNIIKNEKRLIDAVIGETFNGHLLVSDVTKGTTRNGKTYLKVSLSDASLTISTMVWNVDDYAEKAYQTGNVLYINGTVYKFNEQLQIDLIHPGTIAEPNDYDRSDLVRTAPISGAMAYISIWDTVSHFEDHDLRSIVRSILTELKEQLETAPAATYVHHQYEGGLLYHTISMLDMAEGLTNGIHKDVINAELLKAGIIMHDIGKIFEYEQTNDGSAAKQSTYGRLKGHISIISELIYRTASRYNLEESQSIILLQHMVLSHHGRVQNGWGSTVSPQIIEAEILHTLDNLDANLDAYKTAIRTIETGQWSDKIFALDQRSFYKHQ